MLHTKHLHIAISTFTVCMLATPALAQENPNEFNAVIACTNITEPTDRLACYDLTAGRLAAAQENGEIVAVSKKELETVERDAFGFNIPSLPNLFGLEKSAKIGAQTAKKPKTIDNPLTAPIEAPTPQETQKSVEIKESKVKSIKPQSTVQAIEETQVKDVTLDIAKTTEFGRGKTRFFFANGQVWEQADRDNIRIPKARNGKQNKAQITKASFGTFNLRINGKGKALKVKRVR